jgi:hypothetical protein
VDAVASDHLEGLVIVALVDVDRSRPSQRIEGASDPDRNSVLDLESTEFRDQVVRFALSPGVTA